MPQHCKLEIPAHERACPVCGADVGYPNVRASVELDEVNALKKRLDAAVVSTTARGCEKQLFGFGQAVLQSRVVISRSLDRVLALVKGENQLYVSFHREVAAGARLPERNDWDPGRASVDALFFPAYHEAIVFGALTLDGRGTEGAYGGYTVVLSDSAVTLRSSVFEENTRVFTQKHNIVAGSKIAPGYRAPWSNRHELSMAKLHSHFKSTTSKDDYPKILLQRPDASKTVSEDFVEVHIYGAIHPKAIEEVVGPKPKSASDKVLCASLKKALKALNAKYRELT